MYQYNNNGNTIGKNSPIENTTYTYDYQNRMISANVTVNAIQTLLEYQYDTDGIRTQKKINNTVINFLVDKNRKFAQVLEERDETDNLIVQYTHGLDLIAQNRSNVLSYYHYDGQHSTRQLSDVGSQVTDEYTYDVFGLHLARSGSTVNNYMYTGEQYDHNVGFYYLRARYYNLEVGRFTTVDPWKGSIYDPVSLHKYIYCNNDPVDFVDWSGEHTLLETVETIKNAIILNHSKLLVKTMLRFFVKRLMGGLTEGAFWGMMIKLYKMAIFKEKFDLKELLKAIAIGGVVGIYGKLLLRTYFIVEFAIEHITGVLADKYVVPELFK